MKSIKQPVFLVGCSRSGTTILQACLAKHPEIFAFPETQLPFTFFSGYKLRQFGGKLAQQTAGFRFAKDAAYYCLNKFGLCRTNHLYLLEECQQRVFGNIAFSPESRSVFLAKVLSDYKNTIAAHCSPPVWVEKTPRNIFIWKEIEHYLPEAKFIHLLRDGEDNIASLVDAGRNYDAFSGRFGGSAGLDKAISYWERSISKSIEASGRDNHFFVSYAEFTADPNRVLEYLCNFLDLNFTPKMVTPDVSSVSRSAEAWKYVHSSTILPAASKFDRIFSKSEQTYVSLRVREKSKELEVALGLKLTPQTQERI